MRYVALVTLAAVLMLPAPVARADDLVPLTFIPVPTDQNTNQQPGGAFSSFDISFADPVTGNIFIADRSNASVDIFSGNNPALGLLGRATGFTGQVLVNGQPNNNLSGADGVLTVTSGGVTTLYAGDGSSTLRVYNATNPMSPIFQQAISTGGTTRVDEMAFSPATNQILAANNAESPAYGNLFSTNNGHAFAALTFPGGPPNAFPNNQIIVPASQGGSATGGMEQPAWNPQTTSMLPPGSQGSFWVSIPALFTQGTGNPASTQIGGLAQISTAGKVLQTIDFSALGISSCSPTGLAVSGSGNMLVGCGNVGTQAVLLDKNGQFIKSVTAPAGKTPLGGTDEIWFDPTTNKFYVTGNNGTNTTRFFDVFDANGNFLQEIDLPATTSAHSITVDPMNGLVFVALAGTATVNGVPGVNPCPTGGSFTNPGCIEVFGPATAVPGPIVGAGLPGLLAACGALLALARRRRRQRTV
jgi:hypothetical protein